MNKKPTIKKLIFWFIIKFFILIIFFYYFNVIFCILKEEIEFLIKLFNEDSSFVLNLENNDKVLEHFEELYLKYENEKLDLHDYKRPYRNILLILRLLLRDFNFFKKKI